MDSSKIQELLAKNRLSRRSSWDECLRSLQIQLDRTKEKLEIAEKETAGFASRINEVHCMIERKDDTIKLLRHQLDSAEKKSSLMSSAAESLRESQNDLLGKTTELELLARKIYDMLLAEVEGDTDGDEAILDETLTALHNTFGILLCGRDPDGNPYTSPTANTFV